MLTQFQTLSSLHLRFSELFWVLETCFPREEKVAVALSGGNDSMFLSFLIASFWEKKKWNPDQLFFLHCNHQVRPESNDEELFLKDFFKTWNFKVFKRGISWAASEDELRKWRYACFDHFCKEQKIQKLILGHNLTDRIETSLMNLIRGCGIQGFLNMQLLDTHPLLEDIQVIRPLLTLSKEQIETACQELQIPFVQDQTNFDTTTSLRNKVRNEFLFPLSKLSEKNPDGKRSFFESRNLVYQGIKKADPHQRLAPLKRNPYRNASSAYERTIPPGQRGETSALVELLGQLGILYTKGELHTLQNRLSTWEEGFRERGTWTLFLAHGKVVIIQGKKRFREKELLLEKKITQSGIQTFGLFQVEIPPEWIGMKLRFPREGSTFQGKSLTKRMINQKIPIFRRNSLPLVENDGKCIVVLKPQQLLF